MKEHKLWIDYAKVILIYLVVVAHSGQISEFADNFICAFHMPAFFMISGYLYKPQMNLKQDLKKNFKRLIIPALFFSFLCWLHYLLRDLDCFNLSNVLYKPVLGLFFYDRNIATPMCGVIWFLVVLFISKMVLNILFMKLKIEIIFFLMFALAVGVSLIAQGDFTILYYVERTMVALPIIFLGYMLKRYEILERIHGNINVILFILITTILFVILQSWNGRVGIHSFKFGHGLFLFYFISSLGSILLFIILKITKLPKMHIITFLSTNTLTILCLHRILLRYSSHIFYEGFSQSFVVLIILLPIIYLFNKYIPQLIGNR